MFLHLSVSQNVHRRGVYTPPESGTPNADLRGEDTLPPTAAAADSTHPTAMHSSYEKCWILGHEVKFLHTGSKC